MRLPDDIVAKCREHGEKIVGDYAAGDNKESAALAILGAEKDPVLQAEAKMAECIFAAEHGLPFSAVNWTGHPELNGIDLVINGIGVDVKHTRPGRRLLIWSAGKGLKRLEKKEFDLFVLVKCKFADCGGESTHWITRREFIAKHKTAQPPAYLAKGTLFMDQSELRSMDNFPNSRAELFGKPADVLQSTWDAYTWIKKHHPERVEAWIELHPEVRGARQID